MLLYRYKGVYECLNYLDPSPWAPDVEIGSRIADFVEHY